MPEHPEPIQIRIDSQEQRSGIPALLAAMPQVHIEVIPLRQGDYDVGGYPCRVFERKTASDFIGSLAQGRLFAQLAGLRRSRFEPILLLEGDPLGVSHSQMRPESIRGALAYIAAVMRVPILPSSGPAESAQGFSARAADADRVVSAGRRPRHRTRCLRAISQSARSVERRRRHSGDGPRPLARAGRCAGTTAALRATAIRGRELSTI